MEYVHYTLKSASNPINVIRGYWTSNTGDMQILINFQFDIKVFEISTEDYSLSLNCIHTQNVFSKFVYIDEGPKINRLTTFFAICSSNILHMIYSPEERLFVLVRKLTLPDLCVRPTFLKYHTSYLIVSATHGGICSFSTDDYSINYSAKPTNIVLQSFSGEFNEIIRVESGNYITRYGHVPFSRMSEEGIPGLIYCFYLDYDCLILCDKSSIFIKARGATNQITLPEHFDNDSITIVSHCILSQGTAIILSDIGQIYKMNAELEITQLCSIENALKVFTINEKYFLVSRSNAPHAVIDAGSGSAVCELRASVGLHRLRPLPPGGFLTWSSGRSFAVHSVGAQHRSVASVGLGEDPVRVFPCALGGSVYLVLSTATATRVLDSQSRDCSENRAIKVDRKFPTIHFALIHGRNSPITVQVSERNVFFRSGSINEKRIFDYKVVSVDSNERQIALALSNGRIVYYSVNDRAEKVVNEIIFRKNYSAKIVALKLNNSPVLAIGNSQNKLMIVTLFFDESMIEELFERKFESVISAIKFISKYTIVIGFENGLLLILEMDDQLKAVSQTTSLKIGTDPVSLSITKDFGLATSSGRTWIIRKKEDGVFIVPLLFRHFTSVNVLGPNMFAGHIQYASVEICELLDDETSIVTTKQYDSYILGREKLQDLIPISGTQFLIVGNPKGVKFLSLIDLELNEIINFEEGEYLAGIGYDDPSQVLVFTTISDVGCFLYSSFVRKDGNGGIENIEPQYRLQVSIPLTTIRFLGSKIISCGKDIIQVYDKVGDKFGLVSELRMKLKKIVVLGDIIYAVKDKMRIVALEYDQELNALKQTAAESPAVHCVQTQLGNFEDGVLAGDTSFNFIIYEKAQRSRINIKTAINVGDLVTGAEGKGNFAIYVTISGAIGAVLDIRDEELLRAAARLLRMVESGICQELLAMTSVDAFLFRKQNFPCTNILDLDIVLMFMKMNVSRRKKICERISPNCRPEHVDSLIIDMINHFGLTCLY